jgi:hypothetical protein
MNLDPILLLPVDAIIAALGRIAVDGVVAKFETEDLRRDALKLVLGQAMKKYATTASALKIARPFFRRNSFLADPAVAGEFAKALRPGGQPDTELIGRYWRETFRKPPLGADFSREAGVLLGYFQDELKWNDSARAVLQLEVMSSTNEEVHSIASVLRRQVMEIENDLSRIVDLIEAGLGLLAPPGIRLHIYDQSGYIEEKTRGFVGRRFVFEEIDKTLTRHECGICYVVAHPGIGKSALIAQLVKTRNYVHHFNIATRGVTSPTAFLGNSCAQLIAAYGLDHEYPSLPSRATQDGNFLVELLTTITAARRGEKIIIAIDALDEADIPLAGTNPLFLPDTVPDGCYFLITTRPDANGLPPRLTVHCGQYSIRIKGDSPSNMADIYEFLRQRQVSRGIQHYMSLHGLSGGSFVEHLGNKSEGNFMYLHHVLREIEGGTLRDRALQELPLGLKQYYSDHLARMRGADNNAWFEHKLQVIATLSALPDPLTAAQIARIVKDSSPARVEDALSEWGQFLQKVRITDGGVQHEAYRIYHTSFHDFLREKTSIAQPAIVQMRDAMSSESLAWLRQGDE